MAKERPWEKAEMVTGWQVNTFGELLSVVENDTQPRH